MPAPSAGQIRWGKSHRRRGRWSGVKSSAESNNPLSGSSGGYEAPTVGYEYALYSHGTTKAAAIFGMVNTKLAHYVSVQCWTGATITVKAMEKLAEPTLIAPKLPSLTKEYKESEDRKVPDPDNQRGKITTKVIVRKTQTKDSAMAKMETDVYILHYKVWVGEDY